MITRQQLHTEIETLNDESLEVVYRLLRNFKQLQTINQSSLPFNSSTNLWDWLKNQRLFQDIIENKKVKELI